MSLAFKMEPHHFRTHANRGTASIPWPICIGCGLIRLRNDFTDWAVKQGCNNEDHPMHKTMRASAESR